jgi:peptide/nickel transport system substrate-binding protein
MNLTPLAARRSAAAVAVVLIGSVLTACSGGSDKDGEPIDASKLITSMPAAQGDVDKITWNVSGEPDTLDPRNAVSYGSGQIVRNMCDGLLKMDANFDISPNMATYEQVTPTELKFTINEGMTFWDGTPVTAEDVAYSLQRSAAPDSVVSFGFIYVKDIKVTGDMEVTLTFTQPDSTFLGGMATIAGAVIEKKWAEETGDKIGTPSGGLMCAGPFKWGSWEAGSSITIERNDEYWNSEELTPKAAEVKFTFVSDDTALAQALEASEIDGSYEVPVATLSTLSKSDAGQLIFGPSTQSASISVANPGGPLADQKLRDALMLAVDRDAVADVVFAGGAEPNYTHLTPATWPNAERGIYQPDYDSWAEARKYDVDAAKQLVEESSYDDSELVLGISAGDQASNRIAQLFQQEAKAIGVNVSIKPMQPLVFDQAGYDASKRKDIDLIYSFSFNSRQEPLEPLGFDLLPGQPYNYTEYDNPEVTQLLNDARASLDPKEQAELIVQAQEIFEPQSALIPMVSTNTATFINDRLTGAITSFAYWSMPQMAYIGASD